MSSEGSDVPSRPAPLLLGSERVRLAELLPEAGQDSGAGDGDGKLNEPITAYAIIVSKVRCWLVVVIITRAASS